MSLGGNGVHCIAMKAAPLQGVQLCQFREGDVLVNPQEIIYPRNLVPLPMGKSSGWANCVSVCWDWLAILITFIKLSKCCLLRFT